MIATEEEQPEPMKKQKSDGIKIIDIEALADVPCWNAKLRVAQDE